MLVLGLRNFELIFHWAAEIIIFIPLLFDYNYNYINGLELMIKIMLKKHYKIYHPSNIFGYQVSKAFYTREGIIAAWRD